MSWDEKKEKIIRSLSAKRKPNTMRNYRVAVEKFEEFWEKVKKVPLPDPADISVEDLEEYQIHMRAEEELKTNTIIKRLGNLIRFLGRAKNPNLAYFYDLIPRREKTPKYYYTEDEIKKILSLYGEENISEFMHKLFLYTLVFTGARKSEVQNLRWDDIFWDKNEIRVVGKFSNIRTIYMDPRLRKILLRYKKAFDAYINYRLMLGQNVTDRLFFLEKKGKIVEPKENSFFIPIKKRAEKAGIRHFNIKKFRSTYVKLMHNANVPTEWVSRQLGHSSTKITREFYHDFDVDRMKEAHEKVNLFREISEDETTTKNKRKEGGAEDEKR